MSEPISINEARKAIGILLDIVTTALQDRDEARAVAREMLYGFLTPEGWERFLKLYPWLKPSNR